MKTNLLLTEKSLAYSSISGFIPTAAVPSTAIIALSPEGEIVLIQRRDTNLSLPGGEIGWGESIKKNIHRNLAAQAGLESIRIRHTVGLGFSPNDSQPHSFSVIVIVDVEGKIEIKDSSEAMQRTSRLMTRILLQKSEAAQFGGTNAGKPLHADKSFVPLCDCFKKPTGLGEGLSPASRLPTKAIRFAACRLYAELVSLMSDTEPIGSKLLRNAGALAPFKK